MTEALARLGGLVTSSRARSSAIVGGVVGGGRLVHGAASVRRALLWLIPTVSATGYSNQSSLVRDLE